VCRWLPEGPHIDDGLTRHVEQLQRGLQTAANAPAAPPRSADYIQPSVAPESECRARGYAVQFTVY
jgi:hypothetical protein